MSSAFIPYQPFGSREDAEAVINTLAAAGHIALLAGGCVRDQLLGLTPKDFDVATDAPPETIRRLFKHTQAVGAAFGVTLVRLNQSTIEVARFRSDGQYLDGRHPTSVQFATPLEDAQRRDFTINGLFYDVALQRVIDYVGGEVDLRDKVLRAIGDPSQRFAEDQLRLLRAVRFAARFGLTIEPQTAAAISVSASKLISISPERIAQELRLMLAPQTRDGAWQLLQRFKLDEVVFRFAPPRTLDDRAPVPLGDERVPLPLVLAAQSFLRHLPAEWNAARTQNYRHALRKALRWSNQEADLFDVLLSRTVRAVQGPIPLALKRRWTDDPIPPASSWKSSDDTGPAATVASIPELLKRLFTSLGNMDARLSGLSRLSREIGTLQKTPNPPPLLDGNDLRVAGLTPGPSFKQALEKTYDEQLEGQITSFDQALVFAKALIITPASE